MRPPPDDGEGHGHVRVLYLRLIAGPLGSLMVATSLNTAKTRSEYLVCFSIIGGFGYGQSHPMAVESHDEQLVNKHQVVGDHCVPHDRGAPLHQDGHQLSLRQPGRPQPVPPLSNVAELKPWMGSGA